MAKNRPSHIAKPVFPGGLKAMKTFVAEHLKYPPSALEAKVQGTVTVRYSLDYRGKVVATKVKKSLGYGCDEEATRVVSLMRFKVPQDRKKKVRIHQDIHIHFNLPPAKEEKKPLQTSAALSYISVQSPRKSNESEKEKPVIRKESYTYTIKW
ncbi:MAG: energy transducer TonB [Bacteroidota bacterium]